jgi:hypothetical protein
MSFGVVEPKEHEWRLWPPPPMMMDKGRETQTVFEISCFFPRGTRNGAVFTPLAEIYECAQTHAPLGGRGPIGPSHEAPGDDDCVLLFLLLCCLLFLLPAVPTVILLLQCSPAPVVLLFIGRDSYAVTDPTDKNRVGGRQTNMQNGGAPK